MYKWLQSVRAAQWPADAQPAALAKRLLLRPKRNRRLLPPHGTKGSPPVPPTRGRQAWRERWRPPWQRPHSLQRAAQVEHRWGRSARRRPASPCPPTADRRPPHHVRVAPGSKADDCALACSCAAGRRVRLRQPLPLESVDVTMHHRAGYESGCGAEYSCVPCRRHHQS